MIKLLKQVHQIYFCTTGKCDDTFLGVMSQMKTDDFQKFLDSSS